MAGASSEGLRTDRVASGDGGDERAQGELEGVIPRRGVEDGAMGLRRISLRAGWT